MSRKVSGFVRFNGEALLLMAVFVSEHECQILFLQGDELTKGAAEKMNVVSLKLGVPIHICNNN